VADRSTNDKDLERLLRSTLPGAMTPVSGTCLDPERLAAWVSGSLPAGEAGTVELHLSSCDRCQAMLAVLAETEPVASASAPFWQRWSVRWLVPLAAAGAAAVLIWMVMPKSSETQPPTQTFARSEPATAPALGNEAAVPRQELQAQVDRRAKATEEASNATQDLQRKKEAGASIARERSDPGRNASKETSPRAIDEMGAPAPAAPPPPGPPSPPAPEPRATTSSPLAKALPPPSADSVTPAEAPVNAAPAAGGSGRGGSVVTIDVTPVDRPAVAGQLSDTRRGEAQGRSEGAGSRTVAAAPPARSSAPIRWRIVNANRVERTSDGSTWEAVFSDPQIRLTAGFSPSPTVCWLVGANGLILVAGDGVHFQRVAFPESVALSAVQAVDARQASVTTTDNRVFTTSDAGTSWTRTR
jgi:hypothetical protein